MEKEKRNNLEQSGWKVGDAQDFLNLSDDEMAYIELKIILSQSLKQRRTERKLTQTELAKLLKSSQSRVAKMEAGDPSVSVDLLIRALLVVGATRDEIAKSLAA